MSRTTPAGRGTDDDGARADRVQLDRAARGGRADRRAPHNPYGRPADFLLQAAAVHLRFPQRWLRDEKGTPSTSTTDPVTLRTVDGGDVTLVPGATWVELVPADRGDVEVAR